MRGVREGQSHRKTKPETGRPNKQQTTNKSREAGGPRRAGTTPGRRMRRRGGSQRGLLLLVLEPLLRVVVVLAGGLPPLLTLGAGAGEGVDVVVLRVDVRLAGRTPIGDVMGDPRSARGARVVLHDSFLPPSLPPGPRGSRNFGPTTAAVLLHDVIFLPHLLLVDHQVLVLPLLVLLRVH